MKIEEYPCVLCSTGVIKDIVFIEFRNSLKVDLPEAVEIVASRLRFTENKKHYLIVDVSNVREISPKAKEYMQRPEAGLKNILGAAFIATNPVSSLIASIFIKTEKDFPARAFSEKADAYNWIVDYRQKISSNV